MFQQHMDGDTWHRPTLWRNVYDIKQMTGSFKTILFLSAEIETDKPDGKKGPCTGWNQSSSHWAMFSFHAHEVIAVVGVVAIEL